MRWYKHDTDASSDAKIKKLLIRHGAVGYAIYFHCLELIAGDISETNITFELEHDSEIIADNLKIKGTAGQSGVDIVNNIMRDIIQLGLFECHDNRIFCFKLLKRLDTSMTSNSKLRNLISSAKEGHDKVMTESCKTRQEENRREQKRIENNIPFKEIIDHLNNKTNSHYKHSTPKTKDLIEARHNEGFTLADFKKVIDKKYKEWKGTEFEQYLRPQTLFGTKFESYLNQKIGSKIKSDINNSSANLEGVDEL